MGYCQTIDLAEKINNDPNLSCIIDVGNANYFTVQQVGGTSSSIFTTNDGGGMQGVIENSAISATNFIDCFGINIASNDPNANYLNQVTNASEVVKFINFGQYIKVISGDPVSKLIVRLYNIY